MFSTDLLQQLFGGLPAAHKFLEAHTYDKRLCLFQENTPQNKITVLHIATNIFVWIWICLKRQLTVQCLSGSSGVPDKVAISKCVCVYVVIHTHTYIHIHTYVNVCAKMKTAVVNICCICVPKVEKCLKHILVRINIDNDK